MRCDEPGNAINENKRRKKAVASAVVAKQKQSRQKKINSNSPFKTQYLHFATHKSTTQDR